LSSQWCAYGVEVYPHTKLDGNGKKFVDGRTDTPEFQSTRSSVGDDLKIEKSPYIGRDLTNFDHIWRDDAVRPS